MRTIHLVRTQGADDATNVCVVTISASTEAYLRALVASAAEEQEGVRGRMPKRLRTFEDFAAEALKEGVLSQVHRQACGRHAASAELGAFIPGAQ